jgi:hypothetical protein
VIASRILSPQGTNENSPPFQRRVNIVRETQSPQGTTERSASEFLNAVSFQKASEFILKANPRVMPLLIINVTNGVFYLRNPDAEDPVGILPYKRPPLQPVVHPLRGTTFDQLNGFGDHQRHRQRQQNVDMIFNPTDRERFEIIGSGYASNIGPQSGLNVF